MAKPIASRNLHGPVRAQLTQTTGQVRSTPDGTPQRQRRGRRPRAPNGATAQDERESKRPCDTLRQAAQPTAKLLARRLIALLPLAAQANVRLVALKVVAASLKGGQAGQVALGRRSPPASIEPQGTPTAAGLIPILFPATMELRLEPRHGKLPPKAVRPKTEPAVLSVRRLGATRRLPRRVRRGHVRNRAAPCPDEIDPPVVANGPAVAMAVPRSQAFPDQPNGRIASVVGPTLSPFPTHRPT